MKPILSIIGPGKVGASLAQMLKTSGQVEIGQLIFRNQVDAAKRHIGTGEPTQTLSALKPCDILMISTPDSQIEPVAGALKQLKLPSKTIVFHCSGALSSELLKPIGCQVASLHPLNTFSEFMGLGSFNGTFCALEGDAEACATLDKLFANIGAKIVDIETQSKAKWHLASVIACNGINALVEASLQLYNELGLGQDGAMQALAPILRQTIEQILKLGPTQALTGPIERGDSSTVMSHQSVMLENKPLQKLYQALAHYQLQMSRAKGKAKDDDLKAIVSLNA